MSLRARLIFAVAVGGACVAGYLSGIGDGDWEAMRSGSGAVAPELSVESGSGMHGGELASIAPSRVPLPDSSEASLQVGSFSERLEVDAVVVSVEVQVHDGPAPLAGKVRLEVESLLGGAIDTRSPTKVSTDQSVGEFVLDPQRAPYSARAILDDEESGFCGTCTFLVAAESKSSAILRAWPRLEAEGIVVDAFSGSPIQGAAVEFSRMGFRDQTDERGKFRIVVPDAPTLTRLVVTSAGYGVGSFRLTTDGFGGARLESPLRGQGPSVVAGSQKEREGHVVEAGGVILISFSDEEAQPAPEDAVEAPNVANAQGLRIELQPAKRLTVVPPPGMEPPMDLEAIGLFWTGPSSSAEDRASTISADGSAKELSELRGDVLHMVACRSAEGIAIGFSEPSFGPTTINVFEYQSRGELEMGVVDDLGRELPGVPVQVAYGLPQESLQALAGGEIHGQAGRTWVEVERVTDVNGRAHAPLVPGAVCRVRARPLGDGRWHSVRVEPGESSATVSLPGDRLSLVQLTRGPELLVETSAGVVLSDPDSGQAIEWRDFEQGSSIRIAVARETERLRLLDPERPGQYFASLAISGEY